VQILSESVLSMPDEINKTRGRRLDYGEKKYPRNISITDSAWEKLLEFKEWGDIKSPSEVVELLARVLMGEKEEAKEKFLEFFHSNGEHLNALRELKKSQELLIKNDVPTGVLDKKIVKLTSDIAAQSQADVLRDIKNHFGGDDELIKLFCEQNLSCSLGHGR
jgi:predicted CopG family antitoxin